IDCVAISRRAGDNQADFRHGKPTIYRGELAHGTAPSFAGGAQSYRGSLSRRRPVGWLYQADDCERLFFHGRRFDSEKRTVRGRTDLRDFQTEATPPRTCSEPIRTSRYLSA